MECLSKKNFEQRKPKGSRNGGRNRVCWALFVEQEGSEHSGGGAIRSLQQETMSKERVRRGRSKHVIL